MTIREITVQELQQAISDGDAPFLLDVRELQEIEICALEFDLAVPLGELEDRFEEVPRDQPVVVYCRSGARSMGAGNFLATQGFSDIANLKGGILAWAREIDPSMPTY